MADENKTFGDSIEYSELTKEHIETPTSFTAQSSSAPRKFATFSLKTLATLDYVMHLFTCYPKNRFPNENLEHLYGPGAGGGESSYTDNAELKEEFIEKLKEPKLRYALKPVRR